MKRSAHHAVLFIGAGLYLALGGLAGFATVNAILLLWLGINRFRHDRSRLALFVIVVCSLVLVIKQIALLIVLVLVLLGVSYLRARPSGGIADRAGVRQHRFMFNMRLDKHSWVLRSLYCWHALGEVRMDLSMAVPEEKETAIVLQGIVGDVELIIPEDYGLEVEASVLFGQVRLHDRSEGGMLQRVRWRSPGYEAKEQQLKLQLYYLVGNIRIRPI